MRRSLRFCILLTLLALWHPGTRLHARTTTWYVGSIAACDGSTDDTAAINNIISNAQPGDYIEFPAGTCVHNGEINVDGKDNLHIYGQGPDYTTLESGVAEHARIYVHESTSIWIENLTMDSPNNNTRDGNSARDAIFANGSTGINVTNVRVYQYQVGVHFEGVTYGGVYDSSFNYMTATGVQADGDAAYGGSYSITIQNNVAYDTGDDAFASVGYCDGGTCYTNQYVGFYGNYAQYAGCSGFTVEGSQYVQVYSNTVNISMMSGCAGYNPAAIRVHASYDGYPSGDTDQIDIYDNTLYALNYFNSTSSDPFNASIRVLARGRAVTNVQIRNNTIVSPNIDGVSSIRLLMQAGGSIDTGSVHDNSFSDVNSNDMIWVDTGVTNFSFSDNYRNYSPASPVWQ